MATIKFNEKKKCYEVRYDAGYDGSGKRIQKFKGGFKKKGDAEIFMAEQISNLNRGTYIEPQKLFLFEYLLDWLKERKETLSPTTYHGYEINIRCHINPYIGGIRLQELKPVQIRKLYSQLSKDRDIKIDGEKKHFKALSGTSIVHVHRVLSKALEDAYKDELIHKNPAKLVTPPSKEKFEASFLSADKIREMITKFENDELYVPVFLAAVLGVRKGEVLGLQWSNVDFENNIIKIRHNYIMVDGKPELREKTKTDKSMRDIVVTDRIMKTIEKHKHNQKILKVRLGEKYHKSDFVCTWPDGQPFNPSHLSHAFNLRLKNYELPKIRFHDLRHSNASLMLSRNMPMKGRKLSLRPFGENNFLRITTL